MNPRILEKSKRLFEVISKLHRANIIKVLIIGLIIGLVFYPWPSADSYGKFSGFDPNNLYIQSNNNFDVQVDTDHIDVESLGPGIQSINLAQSDLPYKIYFEVTVQNQSHYTDPMRITISYPINPNQIHILFSSLDQSIQLEVYNSTGKLIKNDNLLKYTPGQPVSFLIDISTAQSSAEFISITTNNNTSSKTVRYQSEVQSLLRDQSRLVSLEIMGANNLTSNYLAWGGESFWNVNNFGKEQGNSNLDQSNNLFTVTKGNYSQTYIDHKFESPMNVSSYNVIGVTINGSGTFEPLRLWLNTNWTNRFYLNIIDDFTGLKTILLPLSDADKSGTPTFDSIDRIGIDFPKSTGTWGFSDSFFGTSVNQKGAVNVNISDYRIDITPHSFAYAPLTTAYLPASFLLIASIVGTVALFHSDLKQGITKLYGKLKNQRITRVGLFAATFVAVFCLYFFLFGLGDHAFDMFSQKLWSYDIAKYGLLSLFQRPAVTSAASMYNGEGTMHAIFAYSPLAGLYYALIGQIYMLFSSNPTVYDPFFTTVVKSFQTIATLACGLLVFKIMQLYNCSWRRSFIIMLAFLLNPLVLYDAAVWGHQDSFLIFFLFLSLWAYESNHPKIAFSSLALAIMVKSTAFAPAALMIFLLVRKFGIRRLIDGALAGLATGVAVIIPYVASGASPTMFINSTIFRVFQFGIQAFQYPRSAAVSPDGYNIWPLVTYFTGASSRERMWYPDSLDIPFLDISYLLAGEILFISFFLVLLYLAIKKEAEIPGRAALLLGVLMVASTIFLTKTTARYLIFGVGYLIVSYNFASHKTKWLVIGLLTFTSVFAMQGLLVTYTGEWLKMFPAMSPTIPFNGLVMSLYNSDIIITEMILINVFAFILIFASTVKELRSKKK
jgi:hypothetical protein